MKEVRYLFVDLDQTLLKTDIVHEQFLQILFKHPVLLFKLLFKYFRTPEVLKKQLEKIAPITPESLPYRSQVIAFIQEKKEKGQKVILATAADRGVAQKIAAYLGLFDDVLASTPGSNLKGQRKLEAIKTYSKGKPFDYIGDSKADLPILHMAHNAIVVGCLPIKRSVKRFKDPGKGRAVLKELRIHQWAKNLLVFLPLITSHQINWQTLWNSSLGFFCFSLAASSIYILNDLFDLEDDRRHPQKKNRPIASGDLGILSSLVLMGSLIGSVGCLSMYIPAGALGVLGLYYGVTILYSWSLKEMPIVDIYALSALYSVRVIFGHTVTGIPPTPWLIIFCLFFFLSLACLKRVSELTQVKENNQTLSKRRGYIVRDLSVLIPAGIGCALSSILVFGLYINSWQVKLLYAHPEYLWGSACLLLFWKLRLWFLGGRGLIDQDPVLFVMRDKITIVVGLGVLLSAFLGSIHGF